MPLHTFLPSSTEVLPLPLAVPVVAALLVSLVMTLLLLPLDAPVLLPVTLGNLRLRVCGSPGHKVGFARGRVRGSLLEKLRAAASPLRPLVPLALVEDVRLVSGGC